MIVGTVIIIKKKAHFMALLMGVAFILASALATMVTGNWF